MQTLHAKFRVHIYYIYIYKSCLCFSFDYLAVTATEIVEKCILDMINRFFSEYMILYYSLHYRFTLSMPPALKSSYVTVQITRLVECPVVSMTTVLPSLMGGVYL